MVAQVENTGKHRLHSKPIKIPLPASNRYERVQITVDGSAQMISKAEAGRMTQTCGHSLKQKIRVYRVCSTSGASGCKPRDTLGNTTDCDSLPKFGIVQLGDHYRDKTRWRKYPVPCNGQSDLHMLVIDSSFAPAQLLKTDHYPGPKLSQRLGYTIDQEAL